MYRLMEMGLDFETDITPSFENKDNNNRQTLLSAIEKSGKEDLKRSLEWALLQTSVKNHCDQAVSAKRKTM